MLKNITSLEIVVENRTYKFICDLDSPIGEVHDALHRMKGYVIDRINEFRKSENPISEKNECLSCNQES